MGEFDEASGIVRVELSSRRGSTELAVGNGHFLGQLPEGGSPGTFPPEGPYVVVGYDAAGKEVASFEFEAPR